MAWLFLGFLLLLIASLSAGGAVLRIAALFVAASAFAAALGVYPGWRTPALVGAALALAWPVARMKGIRPAPRVLLIVAGAACCAFARFGPADGLF